MRDPDPVRPPGGDAGLDGGADVVDVDVHVPQPLATHHHQRVAEACQGGPQPADGLSVSVEQIHHLVGGAALDEVASGLEDRLRDPARTLDPGRDPARERSLGRVEDHHDAATAGVDHPGVAECLELVRGSGEGRAGGGRRRGQHVARTGVVLRLEQRLRGFRRGPADAEHRALDRRAHGGVARLGRPAQRVDHDDGVPLLRGRCHDPADDGTQHLAEDHAGVAARAQQRPPGERLERRAAVGIGPGGLLAHGVAGRSHGQVEVGPGVTVGDRIDVEGVDLLARARQGIDGDVDEPQHRAELDARPAVRSGFHSGQR